jgi:hypothetical protein
MHFTWGAGGTFNLGGAVCSHDKAVRLPSAKTSLMHLPGKNTLVVLDELDQWGAATFGYTVSSPALVAITFPQAYSSTTNLNVQMSLLSTSNGEANSATCSPPQIHWIGGATTLTTTGFTASVPFTTQFQGVIMWRAIGPK